MDKTVGTKMNWTVLCNESMICGFSKVFEWPIDLRIAKWNQALWLLTVRRVILIRGICLKRGISGIIFGRPDRLRCAIHVLAKFSFSDHRYNIQRLPTPSCIKVIKFSLVLTTFGLLLNLSCDTFIGIAKPPQLVHHVRRNCKSGNAWTLSSPNSSLLHTTFFENSACVTVY